MGGFASFIGGAGRAAEPMFENERERRFRHQQETLALNQSLQAQLAARAEALGQRYEGTHGHEFDMLSMKLGAAPLGTDLTPFITQLEKLHTQAREAAAMAAQNKMGKEVLERATQPSTDMPRVGGVTPVQGGGMAPPPFAPMIAKPQAPPAAPTAALPAGSPVQGGGNRSQAPFPVSTAPRPGSGPSVPPAAAAPQGLPDLNAALPAPVALPNLDLSNAVNEYNTMGRVGPTVSAMLPSQIEMANLPAKERLKLDLGLEGSRRKIQEMREQNILTDELPKPMQTAIGAGAYGINIPGYTAMNQPRLLSSGTMGRQAPPGTLEFGTDQPVNPEGKYRVMMFNGETIWQPMRDEVVFVPNKEGGVSAVNRNTQEVISPIEGAVTPSMLGTSSSSTVTSPGAAPVTTSTQRRRVVPGAGAAPAQAARPSGGAAAPTVIPPVGAGGATPASRPATGGVPSAISQRAKQVASGDLPLPSGRDGAAVQQYMAEHGMEIPTPMSAAGQKNLFTIDSVLSEIQDLEQALAQIKGNPNLTVPYVQYKYLGQSTPYDALFTKLSFEGLRSAAAALQGNNSRAYPVIKRAFEHVPNLDRMGGLNPDSVALMKDKLKAMRGVLGDARKAALADERKSGAIAPIEGSSPVGPAPKTAEEYLQQLGR